MEFVSSLSSICKEFMEIKTPNCLPFCISELCGGWTQETYKQIIQKLNKKNAAPLMLWFDSPDNMEIISNKKMALQETFKLFDNKKIGRIDATELFAIFLFLSKGDYNVKIMNIVEIFGQEKSNSISADEAYFFFDSFFKGLFKIILKKGQLENESGNRRLAHEDLANIISQIFGKEKFLLKDEFFENIRKNNTFNGFLERMHECMQTSLIYARDEALNLMKMQIEIRKCLMDITLRVDKAIKDEAKLISKE